MIENKLNITRLFFTEHEWLTIDAAVARVIPTDHEPGAREAGVTYFIDRFLSDIEFIHAKADGSGFRSFHGKAAEAWKERIRETQLLYREGIRTLDDLSTEAYRIPFIRLSPEQQDAVLGQLEKASASANGKSSEEARVSGSPPSNQPATTENLDFFQTLILHTREGFYADPIYGGNAERVGWKVIGFPGPASLGEVLQRTYTSLGYLADDEVWSNRGAPDANAEQHEA